ncbi:MAG TPA: hypothetical protein VHT74_18170, partial [Acetobacteraceae bacterium]|nr:hypothetical protein [Acetobacteraceae bacterium]
HIDGVESELVIEHQDHSTQSNPLAVREVRRILVEQLGRAATRLGSDQGLLPHRSASRLDTTMSALDSRIALPSPGLPRTSYAAGRVPSSK